MQKLTKIAVFTLVLALIAPLAARAQDDNTILHQISNAQAALYDKVGPSVVRIVTRNSRSATMPSMEELKDSLPWFFKNPEFWEGSPYEFYFQNPHGQRDKDNNKEESEGQEPKPKERFSISGVGSGTVIRVDSDGAWILTNNHVVGDAEKVDIAFRDEYPITSLEVVSDMDTENRNTFLDEKTDLALIHLTPEVVGERKLTPIEFGDSDALRVGQIVFTLGSPLDREQTFSQGIISAKDRGNVLPGLNEEEIRYEGFLQTTAFINVGNSGGPLIDVDGRMVGIDVAIQTAGGLSNGFIGIGFAIPSNRAKTVADALMAHGKVVRGYLGVKIQAPDLDASEYFNLKPKTGAKVMDVIDNTPAAKGGIKKNDIILTFNGKPVLGTTHLQELVAAAEVNHTAEVEVLRGKDKVKLAVPIEPQPDEPAKVVRRAQGELSELGASLRDPSEDEAKYYEEAGFKGVIVGEIDPSGPLAGKIPKGSLITAIEQNKVASVEDVKNVLDKIYSDRSDKREIRVMITYVPSSSEKTEEFQIIKLEPREDQ
ncbi:MAG: Periplasmic serine endoprotease DegP [bacterium]|nr:Periplasmic serine endoprotease DegP [bacterium]